MLSERRKFGISFSLRLAVLALAAVFCMQAFAPASYAETPKISKQSVDLLTRTGEALAEIAAAVKPAIVNISTTRTVKVATQMEPFFNDPFFRRFFGDRNFGQNHPSERKSYALGSGVITSSDGYIITNYHVVKGADKIKVTLSDQREFTGKVIGSDPKTDIAVVKIKAKDLPVLPFGNSDLMKAGDIVIAVGNPYGLNQTVTMGIVSATGRSNVGLADYEDYIQTDAAINPGNSGGALVNASGQLIGINTAIFSTTGGYQGIGFAIPSDMVKTIMDSLIKYGKVTRGWLGVSIQKISPELAKQFGLKNENGALVSDVVDKSPARKAGLERGDVIIKYDGKEIEEPYQLRNMVANTRPGGIHEITVLRNGKEKTLKVTIGEMPAEMQQGPGGEYQNVLKGVGVQDITPAIASKLNIPGRIKGVVVNSVNGGSPAAGVLKEGDVIQEINRHRIKDVKEYMSIVSRIKADETVLLLIYRNGSSVFVTLSFK
ncbi:MAG: DegQ family serine endoprotease [Candidatus Sulfobium sp.]